MTLAEKVEELNRYCEGSLNFTHYAEWVISSYRNGSLFVTNGKVWKKYGGQFKDTSFKRLVDKAYRLMLEDKEERGIE